MSGGRPASALSMADWTFAQVDASGDCWEWKGVINRQGYGRAKRIIFPRQTLAHRVVYELLVGPLTPDVTLDHLCRNRRCVNPDHLEPVSAVVNTLRGYMPAAMNARKTHCVNGHEFTPENTYRWAKRSGRTCRRCVADRVSRQYWARKNAA